MTSRHIPLTEEEANEAADNGRNTGGKSYYRPPAICDKCGREFKVIGYCNLCGFDQTSKHKPDTGTAAYRTDEKP
jgi:ribosomal protein L37E